MNILEKLRQGSHLTQLKSELKLSAERVQRASSLVRPGAASSIFHVPPQQKTSLADFLAKAGKRTDKPNPGLSEIQRIIQLPISFPLTDEELEAYCKANILRPAFDKGFRFKLAQAEALMSYELFGAFCPIGAGAGKTLVSVGLATRAYSKGIQRILMLIPSHVYYQFVMRSLPWIRNQIPVNVPFICMGNATAEKRLAMAHSNRPGCYVLPYSCLSTKDSVEVVTAIQPGLIIADEAHRISSRRAARTKRIDAYMKAHPGTEFVPMSGTMTNKSVMEYHHLISWALKQGSPLPLSGQMASEWGMYVDSKAEYTGSHAGPIKHVVDWARTNFPGSRIDQDVQGFRTAFRHRLTSAPGVVATADSAVATSLYLSNRPVVVQDDYQGWAKVKSLMEDIVNGTTPNGDTIEHAIHSFRWLYELSAGFYNELVWPTAEAYSKRRGISLEEAADQIERAQQHHDLAQIFAKLLRRWMSTHHRPNMDTPLLVRSDMALHGYKNVGKELFDAWQDMRHAEFEGMPERDSNAIRVCDYKVQAAVEWAADLPKNSGGIIWAYNQELVSWIHQRIPGSLLANAGEASNRMITDLKNKDKIFVASIMAHGEGKELQHFQHQYYAQWPRVARTAEQVLARLHRLGQEADELTAHTNNTTLFDQMNFAACLIDALYIQQTTGNRQRVIYAGYDPLPIIFPPSVLRERGMDNKMLSAEHQQVLTDLFGNFTSETKS